MRDVDVDVDVVLVQVQASQKAPAIELSLGLSFSGHQSSLPPFFVPPSCPLQSTNAGTTSRTAWAFTCCLSLNSMADVLSSKDPSCSADSICNYSYLNT